MGSGKWEVGNVPILYSCGSSCLGGGGAAHQMMICVWWGLVGSSGV